MKRPYAHLESMVQIPTVSSHRLVASAPGLRLTYILDVLKAAKLGVDSDVAFAHYYMFDQNKRMNLVASIKGTNPDASTLGFCAHHDIVNPHVDNVWDNTASVAHLLSLYEYMCKYRPVHNCICMFTDAEEAGAKGADLLGKQTLPSLLYGHVQAIINLELTAAGSAFWLDPTNSAGAYMFKRAVMGYKNSYRVLDCPGNDAVALRRYGFDAVCVGSLSRNIVQQIKTGDIRTPPTWGLCHGKFDTFDTADDFDMNVFQGLLRHIADNDWTETMGEFNVGKQATMMRPKKKFPYRSTMRKEDSMAYIPSSHSQLTNDELDFFSDWHTDY